MEKTCPNCKQKFDCKADDIENCLCNSIQLNNDAVGLIKNQFEDCLCVECLKEIENKFRQ